MKKILFLVIISLVVANAHGQAILKHNGKEITLSDRWVNILDDSYEIIYSDGTIKVPNLSGVYFNEYGLLDVVHFPTISGNGAVEIDINNTTYQINGISFFEDGKPGWIWLNHFMDIELPNEYDENHLYRAASSICAVSPFDRGSILFSKKGNIDWLLIDKENDFIYEDLTLKITGWIIFHENGTALSIRLSNPKEMLTPLGEYNIATIGFYDDAVLKYVTIQSETVNTKYGDISINKSIDFYKDGKLYVTFITSSIEVDNVKYKNVWIGFDENGEIIGEMKFVDNDWVKK